MSNSSPTAASMSTDLYGMAALDACEQITERLKPIVAGLPEGAPFSTVLTASLALIVWSFALLVLVGGCLNRDVVVTTDFTAAAAFVAGGKNAVQCQDSLNMKGVWTE